MIRKRSTVDRTARSRFANLCSFNYLKRWQKNEPISISQRPWKTLLHLRQTRVANRPPSWIVHCGQTGQLATNDDAKRNEAVAPDCSTSSDTASSTISVNYRSQHRRSRRNKSSSPFLCGALAAADNDVDGTLRADARDLLRQIVQTLRSFGPEEKEAVRETLIDASNVMKRALRAVAGPFKCDG